MERSRAFEEPDRARLLAIDLDVLLATANDDLPTFLAGATAARGSLDPTGDNDVR
jgi:hypothetical protein